MTLSPRAIEAAARAIAATIPLNGERWNPPHGQDFPHEYTTAEQKLIRAIATQAVEAALASACGEHVVVPVNIIAELRKRDEAIKRIGPRGEEFAERMIASECSRAWPIVSAMLHAASSQGG